MLGPSAIAAADTKVLMEIYRDFGHEHDMLVKIIRNEKPLIYYGFFSGHEWSDDTGNSSGVYYFYIYLLNLD